MCHRSPATPTRVIVGVSVAISGIILVVGLVSFVLRARRRRRNDTGTVSPFVRVGSVETPGGGVPHHGAKERLQHLETELSAAHVEIEKLSARVETDNGEETAEGVREGSSERPDADPDPFDGLGGAQPASEADRVIATLRIQVARLEAEIQEARALDAPPEYTAA
jgi:hypothetical protein